MKLLMPIAWHKICMATVAEKVSRQLSMSAIRPDWQLGSVL